MTRKDQKFLHLFRIGTFSIRANPDPFAPPTFFRGGLEVTLAASSQVMMPMLRLVRQGVGRKRRFRSRLSLGKARIQAKVLRFALTLTLDSRRGLLEPKGFSGKQHSDSRQLSLTDLLSPTPGRWT